MNRAQAEMLEAVFAQLPREAQGRVAACFLRLILDETGSDPVIDRVVGALARTGDRTKARRSWTSLRRQVQAAGLYDEPSWQSALVALDLVLRYDGWMGLYSFEALGKAIRRVGGQELAGYLATQCLDEAVCSAYERANLSGLVGLVGAVRARRALAGGLATVGLYLLERVPEPLAPELGEVLAQTLRYAEGRGAPATEQNPIGGRRSYLASGAAYTAFVPHAVFGSGPNDYVTGGVLSMTRAGYTAADSYARVRAVTPDDPGGWDGQKDEQRALADVFRAAVACPSVRDAIDGAYAD